MSCSSDYSGESRRGKKIGVLLVALVLVGGLVAPPMANAQDTSSKKGAADTPEKRLAALGIELPTPPPPVANYVRAVSTGNLVFLAGHGPLKPDGSYVTGKLGQNLALEEGYEAARLTAIALLASLKAEIGELSRVKRIVKVTGMVNSDPTFIDQPKVINGCSDLLVSIFGDRGKRARSPMLNRSKPLGIAVEIEMVVEVE